MKIKVMGAGILALLLIAGGSYAVEIEFDGDLLIITGDKVNVRFSPSTASTVVAQAKKGDIFELSGKTGNWYRIYMFSGMFRYVYSKLAKPFTGEIFFPDSAESRKDIFLAIENAEDRSIREAEEKHPVSIDISANVDYKRILQDRYKLDVMHKFNLQTPIEREISLEGVIKKWDQ
jgi:hypothetical protein